MQWSQIKSILILSFFILNAYLFAQFLEKKEQADIGVLEQDLYSIEEQLEDDDIEIGDLPEKSLEETFISVEPYEFSTKELKQDKPKKSQETVVLDDTLIVSKLKTPLKVDTSSDNSIMNKFNEIAYYSDNYHYWGHDETYNILIFFQDKLDRPIYFNKNGLVLAILNEDDEIEGYIQTMLGEEEPLDDKRELIEPLTAIEKVYENDELKQNDEISKVTIGFHTRVPSESGVQVFAPTWKINVNDEQDYFVNAMEGFIFSTEEEEFLEEVLSRTNNQIKDNLDEYDKDEKKMLEQIGKNIKSRLKEVTE